MARKHGRPRLHLDMMKLTMNQAAQKLRGWIADNSIAVINVVGPGPRQLKDPDIYDITLELLQATLLSLYG